MYKSLSDTIADVLSYHGAVVDKTSEEYLDVVFPSDLAPVLGVPEYARLSFSYGGICEQAIPASYDSEFFVALEKLFAGKGKFAMARFEPPLPKIEKTARLVEERITLNNAVFRMDRTETVAISYLLVCLKYTALSDEKHEGIVPVLANGMNLSTIPFENGIADLMDNLQEPVASGDSTEERSPLEPGSDRMAGVFRSALIAGSAMVKERQQEFMKSLERRLNRDAKRITDYYQALKGEIERKMERRRSEVEIQTNKLLDKLNAVETERKWKIQDLIAKYGLNIQIEPIAAIAIKTQALVFWITIKRRLASRNFPVTYNTIAGGFDPLPCESCFYPREGHYLCDDKLHIICGVCFAACPCCGKQYCRTCHKNACPKCR